MTTTPEKFTERLKKVERQAVKVVEKKKRKAKIEASDLPLKQGNRADSGFKNGTDRDSNPRSHALSSVKMRENVDRILVRDLADLEKAGYTSPTLDFQTAETMAKLVANKVMDPQEALDIISTLACMYHDNPGEFRKYRRLIHDVLSASYNYGERPEAVEATHKALDQIVADGNIDYTEDDSVRKSDAVESVKKALENEAASINKEYLVKPEDLASEYAQTYVEKLRELNIKDTTERFDLRTLRDARREIRQDKYLTNTDKEKLIDMLTRHEKRVADLESSVPRHEHERWKRIQGRLTKSRIEVIGGIREKFIFEERRAVPADLNSFLTRFEDAIALHRYVLDADGNISDIGYINAADVPFAELRGLLQEQVQAGNISAAESSDFEAMVQLMEQRGQVQSGMERMGAAYRLKEAGLRSEAHLRVHDLATNPDKFFAELAKIDQRTDIGDRAKKLAKINFIEEFAQNTRDTAIDMLAVIDSDMTQFSDQIFISLIHEQVYNQIVSGVHEIANRLKDEEYRDLIIEVSAYEYNRETANYEHRALRAGKFVDDLRIWLRDERVWKRYTHNIYVLMLTHNYDAFARYANSVESAGISRLFEQNPALELAMHYHMGYVYARHGMEYWKAPHEVYTIDPHADKKTIAVDEHVKKQLRYHTSLSEREIDRLTALSRGVALGVTMEGVDVILSSGQPRDMPPTEQFGPIGWNQLITDKRFQTTRFFPDHDFYWVRVGNKKKTGFGFRRVGDEIEQAKAYKARVQARERDRIITDKEMDDDGLPFGDWFHMSMSQSGGFGNREYSWRGVAWDKIYVRDAKGHLLYGRTIDKVKVANPQLASALINQWYGEGKINKNRRNELRENLWKYLLKDIAPQAAFMIDRDLFYHQGVKAIQLNYGGERAETLGDIVARADTGDHVAKDKILELLMDAEAITRHVLNGSGVQAGTKKADRPNLDALGDDINNWFRALFPVNRPRGANDRVIRQRVERVKTFMEFGRGGFADTLISRGHKLKIPKVVASPDEKARGVTENKTVSPWREARRVYGFPSQYKINRRAEWEKMGERVIGRLVGDSITMQKTYDELAEGLYYWFRKMQSHPDKIKDAEFADLMEIFTKMCRGVDSVHGTNREHRGAAVAQATGYLMSSMVTKWFGKGSFERYVPGSSYISPASSWSHWKFGDLGAELEAQEIRKLADMIVKNGVIAPYHGYRINKDENLWLNLGLTRIPTPIIGEWKKVLGPLKVPVFGKSRQILGPIRLPIAKRAEWNARDFRLEHGAMDAHLMLDIAESYAPVIIALVILAAMQKGLGETEEG